MLSEELQQEPVNKETGNAPQEDETMVNAGEYYGRKIRLLVEWSKRAANGWKNMVFMYLTVTERRILHRHKVRRLMCNSYYVQQNT